MAFPKFEHVFKFCIGQDVGTPHLDSNCDLRVGEITARSEHSDGRCDQYLVRFTDHNGCEVEEWFAEDRLT